MPWLTPSLEPSRAELRTKNNHLPIMKPSILSLAFVFVFVLAVVCGGGPAATAW